MNAIEKICVACGESCAGQPRIKDPAGHYYHKECHERLQRAQAARQAAAAPEQAEAPAPEVPVSDQPAEVADHDLPDQAPPAACPGCGEPMLLGAMICINCGFNAHTGRMVDGAEVPGRGGGSGEPVWPLVIGIISIAFGGGGVLLHAFAIVGGLIEGMGTDEPASTMYGRATGSLLFLALSIWLLSAGIGVVQHKQTAAVSIKRWAIVKTVLYATCFTCVSAAILFLGGMTERLNDEFTGGESAVGTGLLLLIFAAVFAWFLFWPIFILIWFGRDRVQEQLGHWR